MFGAVLFTFGTMLWLPIVIYVPALAFNQGNNRIIWNQFKTNIRLFAIFICSHRGERPLNHAYSLCRVYFLHLRRRAESCSMDGLHSVRYIIELWVLLV